MCLKHILYELQQLVYLKMKIKKTRRKLILVACVMLAGLIAVLTVNRIIIEKQFSNAALFPNEKLPAFDPQAEGDSNSSDMADKNPNDIDYSYGNSGEMTDHYIPMQPTPLMSAIIISGIFGTAIITSMALYLQYRKRHIDQVPPLAVLTNRRDSI